VLSLLGHQLKLALPGFVAYFVAQSALKKAVNDSQWRTQLMRYIDDKIAAHDIGLLILHNIVSDQYLPATFK